MHIKTFVRVRPQCLYDIRANGDVGHKMPVHDIDVDVIGTGLRNGLNLIAQTGKVGGQDGWGDAGALLHDACRSILAARQQASRGPEPERIWINPSSLGTYLYVLARNQERPVFYVEIKTPCLFSGDRFYSYRRSVLGSGLAESGDEKAVIS